MLPAPAQGAIMVVCREDDERAAESCSLFNDESTALCTRIERDFLRTLLGGCSTPISSLAEFANGSVMLKANIVSPDGKEKVEVEKILPVKDAERLGVLAAEEILLKGGQPIVESIRKKIPANNGFDS